MPRRSAATPPEAVTHPDWPGILEAALTLEGSVGDTYARCYRYSMGNIAFLMYQGVTPQPVANYKRWQELGRHVKRGASAYYILRPITVKLDELDDDGEPKTIQRFKPVKSVFPISMTEGEPLPHVEHPEWRRDRALANLAISLVPFEDFDGNMQGYSYARNIAINPLARYPDKTFNHEVAHVVLGHTSDGQHSEYQQHRGVMEFEAEGTAHLTMTELELMTPEMASESRGYIQTWLGEQKPSDANVRHVLKAADEIIRAGRIDDNSTT